MSDDDNDKYISRGQGIYIAAQHNRTKDPYEDLANAIIFEQLKILDKGLKEAKREGLDIEKVSNVLRAKSFFHSSWCDELRQNSVSGPTMFQKALDNFEEIGTVFRYKEDKRGGSK